MQSRIELASDNLFPDTDGSDGLSASILRLGGGMTAVGPDPAPAVVKLCCGERGARAQCDKLYALVDSPPYTRRGAAACTCRSGRAGSAGGQFSTPGIVTARSITPLIPYTKSHRVER